MSYSNGALSSAKSAVFRSLYTVYYHDNMYQQQQLASNQALLICVWAEKRAWYTLSAHVPTLLFKIHKLKRM